MDELHFIRTHTHDIYISSNASCNLLSNDGSDGPTMWETVLTCKQYCNQTVIGVFSGTV